MPLFDAVTVTFGTAGTGGFAIKTTVLPVIPLYSERCDGIYDIIRREFQCLLFDSDEEGGQAFRT